MFYNNNNAITFLKQVVIILLEQKCLTENSMVDWKTVFTSNHQVLGTVDIKRGIFQGDSLSPLLFVIIMLSLNLRDTRAF